MPEAPQEQTSQLAVGASRRNRNLRYRLATGAAAALLVAILAWHAQQAPTQVVALVAAAPAATAAAPTFCPAARAFVDALPLIQVSLTDSTKLPGLLSNAASTAATPSFTSAPPAVQADIATLTKTIGDIQTATAAANNQLTALAPQQALSLQSPTVEHAISRLLHYVNTTCGPS